MTQTYTATATAVPEPYTVTVNIYNSAGELVRGLYNGDAENSATQAQIVQTGTQMDITGLDGNAGSNLVWNETNNNGQSVASGVYTVQIVSVNSFGQTQTLTKMVTVVDVSGPAGLEVFNSAGELVANLSPGLSSLPSEPVNMSFPPGQDGMTASADPQQGGLKINLTLADGNTETVFWSGLNGQGQPLQSGNYLVTLSQYQAGADEILKTEPIVLVGSADTSAAGMAGSALVLPNPVQGGSFDVQYQASGTDTAAGVLYNLAGQRVAEAADAGSGTLHFSGAWSSGIYLLDFEVRSGSATLARKILKVAIVR
jgi:flagellar hook assembly protein FlgD